MPYPTSRAISRALATLQTLPPPALALLAERLIDTLDGAQDTDADLDVDDWPLAYPVRDGGAGDADDAEGDDDDCCPAGDDDPASPVPLQGLRGMHCCADPLDAEPDADAEWDGPPVSGAAWCRAVQPRHGQVVG